MVDGDSTSYYASMFSIKGRQVDDISGRGFCKGTAGMERILGGRLPDACCALFQVRFKFCVLRMNYDVEAVIWDAFESIKV